MRTWNRLLLAWLLGLVAALATARGADAGDFRVDTEVFKEEEKEPFLQTLTIFKNDVMYDFLLNEPREVTVFDPLRGRLTLLHEARKVKATISTQEILDFTLALETHAAKQKDKLLVFYAKPQFAIEAKDTEQNGQAVVELKLTANLLNYAALGQRPERADAVKMYRQFCDWAARLNATRPGNPPSAARLVLNKELADRELLPLEITLTLPPSNRFGKKVEMKSQHRVNWALSGEDLKKVERAGDMMATFQVVSYHDYLRDPAKSTDSKQVRE